MPNTNAKPLSVEERKLLVEKALALNDPDMLPREVLEMLTDDGLRAWAEDFSEDEAFERALQSDFPEGLGG